MPDSPVCTIPGCIRPRIKGRGLCAECERLRQQRKARLKAERKRWGDERKQQQPVESAHVFAIRLLVDAAKR